MSRPPKQDWDSIRAEHVERGVPFSKLAETHGIPAGSIRARASREDWAQLRRLFEARIARARAAEKTDHLAREASEFDQTAFKTAKAAMALIARSLNELSRAAAEWSKADQARAEETQGSGASSSSPAAAEEAGDWHADRARQLGMNLERIGRAATAWIRIAHEALGDVPTQRLELADSEGARLAIRAEVKTKLQALTREERLELHRLADRAGLFDELMSMLDRGWHSLN